MINAGHLELNLNSMKSVFILQHAYALSVAVEEETRFIGVYSSREKSQAVVERLSIQPGFKDFPNCFYIEAYEIDQDHWREGFETQTP